MSILVRSPGILILPSIGTLSLRFNALFNNGSTGLGFFNLLMYG